MADPISYFNVTNGLANSVANNGTINSVYDIQTGIDVFSEIFTGSKILGMGFILSLIVILISLILITRNTSKWIDISAPLITMWAIFGLNIPNWIIAIIGLIWVINQVGIKNVSYGLNAITKTVGDTLQETAQRIGSVTGGGFKSDALYSLTKRRLEERKRLDSRVKGQIDLKSTKDKGYKSREEEIITQDKLNKQLELEKKKKQRKREKILRELGKSVNSNVIKSGKDLKQAWNITKNTLDDENKWWNEKGKEK